MRYKKYPSYKESGVEWLGDIPEHWENTRLKFLGDTYGGLSGKAGKDFNQENNKDNKIFIPFTNIANNHYIQNNNFGTVTIFSNELQNKIKKNDLFFLMSSEGYEDLGKSSLLKFEIKDGYLNSFCKGFRVKNNSINPKYLNYLLSGDTYRKLLYTQGNGFTRINLRLEKLQNLSLLIAPIIKEQKAIANYLDNATNKIDTLIIKQKRLIELLKEKRQALISKAVTRGLDDSVEMKESGVEWLGEIPEHWEMKKLKFIATINDDTLSENTSNELMIKYIDIGSVITGYIKNYEEMSYSLAPSRARRIVKEGDIIVSTVRTYLKAIAPISNVYNNFIVSTGFAVIRSREKLNSNFSKYALISKNFVDLVESHSVGISYPAINSSDLIKLKIVVPPIKEQKAIANYLDQKTTQIDILISKATKAITLLQEKRTALISAVVTGKIDVRGEYGE